jgi:hypothetical protein
MALKTRNHVVTPLGLAIPKLPATSVILSMAIVLRKREN